MTNRDDGREVTGYPRPPGRPELTTLRHTGNVEQMGRVARGVAIAAVAALCGFVTMVLTVVATFLLHSPALLSTCSSRLGGPQVCTPETWKWLVLSAGVVGAVAGGVVTQLILRHQARALAKAAPPVGQLSDCVPRRQLDAWR
jgi:hypothetical protein